MLQEGERMPERVYKELRINCKQCKKAMKIRFSNRKGLWQGGWGERKKGFLIEFRKLIAAEFITNYARNKLKVA